MCVRRVVLSTPLVACKGIAISCQRNSLDKICEFTIYDLSIGDLSFGCLDVHAIESLDVRVATNFVKMMRKKVARNKSSKFTHPFQFCSQCFIEWSLPHSLVLRNEGVLQQLRMVPAHHSRL